MKAYQTTICYDSGSAKTSRIQAEPDVRAEASLDTVVESFVIGIYPDYTFQTVEGFGCAMTESSCFLLGGMESRMRKEALKTWFGPDGIDARFIRMHIDSCDYCLEEYQSVADPIADPELETFNIARDLKWTIPVVKEAMELAGHPVEVLLSPWSPPWQWKTPPELSQNDAAVYGGLDLPVDFSGPGRKFGGRLKPEYYASWARYIVKFIEAYLEEGIPVTMLSIQNESGAATYWDSCLWSGEQERIFLKEHLYPQMQAAGLTDKVKLFIWDHNKERAIEHIDEFMKDPDAAGKVDGFAYHWYSGDHFQVLSLLKARYPDKILMHSESCPLHIPGKAAAFDVSGEMLDRIDEEMKALILAKDPKAVDYSDAVSYAHDIIGDLNGGMQRWIDWNMIVDRKGGPRHVPGGFAAPVVLEDDGTFTRTPTYDYLHAISRVIRAGAVRLGCSVYGRDIEAVSVRNTDGTIGIVLQNYASEEVRLNIRMDGFIIRKAAVPAGALSTLEIVP